MLLCKIETELGRSCLRNDPLFFSTELENTILLELPPSRAGLSAVRVILPSKLLLAVMLFLGKWLVGEQDLEILLFGLMDKSTPRPSGAYVSSTLPMN